MFKKGRRITLHDRYVKAFETCKNILVSHPLLQYPDFSKPFLLTTDASNIALGALPEKQKELLAIAWATKYFCPYGCKLKIITDHRPFTWLMSLKEPNCKLIKWRLKPVEYDYEIIYKKGKLSSNADTLSTIRIANNDIADVNMNTSS